MTDHVADVVAADDVAGDDVADVAGDADECCAECVADDDAVDGHDTAAIGGHRLNSD